MLPGEKVLISCRLSDIAREHGIAGDMSAMELIDRLLELGYTQAAKEVHDLMGEWGKNDFQISPVSGF